MPIAHLLLAVLVVVIWGINFLFVKLSLEEISPLLLCALRFFLASIPAVFFIKLPIASFRLIALYGLVMFALQFTLLFLGMNAGMTPGMASLIMQVQVFFSMFLAVFFLSEPPSLWQVVGAVVSFIGIGLVAMHFDANVSLLGFVFILAAAIAWGFGNLIIKKLQTTTLIAVIAWGSFVAAFPMLLLALFFEGSSSFIDTYQHVTWRGMGSLLYIVYASTWIGYGIWGWLMTRYPIGMIAPFTLLVPVVGLMSSVLLLGESFQLWKLASCLLVISGLCINLISTRWHRINLNTES